MSRDERFVLWFEEIRKDDVPIVGGKCANLGELTAEVKVPVPPGFAVTTHAYKQFIETTKIKDKIFKKLEGLDVKDMKMLENASAEIRKLIESTPVPEEIQSAILSAYDELSKRAGKNPFVAVRSSASAEDRFSSPSAAGRQFRWTTGYILKRY
ncbi:MAG: PEP/pyruvate-binding domain-containing protein [Candidatus Freyarchaeota archaeon]